LERALAAFPELAKASIAVVGERSAERLTKLGLVPAFTPVASARELSAALIVRTKPRARTLWPRGDRSDELATELRARCTVVDPIVYSTRTLDERAIPACDAVFFASPSAV